MDEDPRDRVQRYVEAIAWFKSVEVRYGEVEEEYATAIDDKQRAFANVARAFSCGVPTCGAVEGDYCTFNGAVSQRSVHPGRERRARSFLETLGVKEP